MFGDMVDTFFGSFLVEVNGSDEVCTEVDSVDTVDVMRPQGEPFSLEGARHTPLPVHEGRCIWCWRCTS
jgi:hypothetical protein